MPCCGEYGVTPYSLRIWAGPTHFLQKLLRKTEMLQLPLVATRRNEEKTSSATSFSYFVKE